MPTSKRQSSSLRCRPAWRARTRQYEVRALLKTQAEAARQLETRVETRTAELAAANEALRAAHAKVEAKMKGMIPPDLGGLLPGL